MIVLEKSKREDLSRFHNLEKDNDVIRNVTGNSLAEHNRLFQKENIFYLNILNNSDTIGFILLNHEIANHSVEFRRIVIKDRNRGFGQIAVRAMESFCKDKLKANRIWLDVFDYNKRGQHIYEKLGYQRFKSVKNEDILVHYYEKYLNS